jgi:hypothetical protein
LQQWFQWPLSCGTVTVTVLDALLPELSLQDAFMDDFQQTLDKFSVPAQEQAELKAIVDSTRADIVVEPEVAATS